ncbi:MAG: hypothetical protein ABH827_06765 [bacterium]
MENNLKKLSVLTLSFFLLLGIGFDAQAMCPELDDDMKEQDGNTERDRSGILFGGLKECKKRKHDNLGVDNIDYSGEFFNKRRKTQKENQEDNQKRINKKIESLIASGQEDEKLNCFSDAILLNDIEMATSMVARLLFSEEQVTAFFVRAVTSGRDEIVKNMLESEQFADQIKIESNMAILWASGHHGCFKTVKAIFNNKKIWNQISPEDKSDALLRAVAGFERSTYPGRLEIVEFITQEEDFWSVIKKDYAQAAFLDAWNNSSQRPAFMGGGPINVCADKIFNCLVKRMEAEGFGFVDKLFEVKQVFNFDESLVQKQRPIKDLSGERVFKKPRKKVIEVKTSKEKRSIRLTSLVQKEPLDCGYYALYNAIKLKAKVDNRTINTLKEKDLIGRQEDYDTWVVEQKTFLAKYFEEEVREIIGDYNTSQSKEEQDRAINKLGTRLIYVDNETKAIDEEQVKAYVQRSVEYLSGGALEKLIARSVISLAYVLQSHSENIDLIDALLGNSMQNLVDYGYGDFFDKIKAFRENGIPFFLIVNFRSHYLTVVFAQHDMFICDSLNHVLTDNQKYRNLVQALYKLVLINELPE